MPEGTEIRWIHPDTRKKAALNAKYAANAARWSLNTAVCLFALIIIVVLMSSIRVNLLLTVFTASLGLFIIWFAARRKARKLCAYYYEEEIVRRPDDWKDYYKCLGIGPGANDEQIDNAYRRLSDIYSELTAEGARIPPLYSILFRDAREAYGVLSVPAVKAEYDRIYWLRYNGEKTDIEMPARPVIVDLSHSISNEVSKYFRKFGWSLPVFTRTQKRICLAVAAVILAVGVSGTSLAFAKPDSALAAPFKGTAMTIAQITSGAIDLIDNVRAIGASSERQVVSTSLQLMRITEDVRHLTPVIEPTNDMACFPSMENSLFPTYLDKRYSQFSYTVDSYGIVTVHTDTATTDQMLDTIKSIIISLE